MIAVDIYGSVIFNHPPQKRYIPGIGSSMVPEILKKVKIDVVVTVFADRGERYADTVYNEEWCTNFVNNQWGMKEL